jgi:hypothetical protein
MADQDIDLDDLDDFADLYVPFSPLTYISRLTCDSYDEEPAPAAKDEPVKTDTEIQAPEPEPTEAFKTDDTDDFTIKTEQDHDVEREHTPQVTNDKPIGMKDDGYV